MSSINLKKFIFFILELIFSLSKEAYLNNLYGRILFVLQINSQNKEFNIYKEEIHELLNHFVTQKRNRKI